MAFTFASSWKTLTFRFIWTERNGQLGQLFLRLSTTFWGAKRVPKDKELVQNLVKHCKILGAILSIELHYLSSPLEHFPENLGDVIDEQGLIFHQDIREMQSSYQGRWDQAMMADYCWCLKRYIPAEKHAKRSKRKKFVPFFCPFYGKFTDFFAKNFCF